jgi:hypothetical protein
MAITWNEADERFGLRIGTTVLMKDGSSTHATNDNLNKALNGTYANSTYLGVNICGNLGGFTVNNTFIGGSRHITTPPPAAYGTDNTFIGRMNLTYAADASLGLGTAGPCSFNTYVCGGDGFAPLASGSNNTAITAAGDAQYHWQDNMVLIGNSIPSQSSLVDGAVIISLSSAARCIGGISTLASAVFGLDIDIMAHNSNAALGVRLEVEGGLTCTDNITSLSDISIKRNIRGITGSLGKLENIRGVGFEYRETGQKSYGVIAQEVEKVFPELVFEAAGGKSLNYYGLIGALFAAAKDLRDRLEVIKDGNRY